jgi:hypothetical protein
MIHNNLVVVVVVVLLRLARKDVHPSEVVDGIV